MMTRDPSTATAICPNMRPEVMASLAPFRVSSICPVLMAMPAPNRTVRMMVTREVIQVDRRVQILIHSETMARAMVWRP